ncbi:hypothetical protein G3A43_40105 [Paraburkholderia aspalathi]|uniref:hypothetical protein n=1 Tax=Paraburkholderia nemoris TaxID=2793076 RepID=UPI00190A219F|nr:MULTISPECIES: hypothetical protein [Paraburkholderia]MBK3786409.1 hypothetical protein [Paraburkholderia aspalathi]
MRWLIPDVTEQAEPHAPPIWQYGVLYLLIQLVGAGLVVLAWPKGQATMTPAFWIAIIVLPALLWGAASGAVYWRYEEVRNQCAWWNLLGRVRSFKWRSWAHARVAIVSSVVLTPEEGLAESILGLEGAAPTNPDKTLSLDQFGTSHGRNRLEEVFASLLAPLRNDIDKLAPSNDVEVVLHVGREDCSRDLVRVWKRLEFRGEPAVKWLAADVEWPLAERWFSEPVPSCRIVLACQLHREGESEFSEVAVGLVLGNPSALGARRSGIKPQAVIFRPIVAEPDDIAQSLSTLLRAEQAPVNKIRHVWMSDLEKITGRRTDAAVREAKLDVSSHDVDRAIGKPGPANPWLLQAVAAEAVQYGEGAQLVATGFRSAATLNIVASGTEAPDAPPHGTSDVVSIGWLIAMTSLFVFIFVSARVFMPSDRDGPLITMLLALCPLFVALQVAITLYMRRSTARRFWQQFS